VREETTMTWSWLSRAVTLWPLIIGAVHAVEAVALAISGKEKQNAAVAAVRAMLGAVEGGLGRDLLNDQDVERAVRGMIDAYVSLQTIDERPPLPMPHHAAPPREALPAEPASPLVGRDVQAQPARAYEDHRGSAAATALFSAMMFGLAGVASRD